MPHFSVLDKQGGFIERASRPPQPTAQKERNDANEPDGKPYPEDAVFERAA